ncbi:MAG TPA: hypothetical protein VGE47_05645, partial [Burkholderiaceae bacterium]
MKKFAIVALKGLGWLVLALVLLFLSWAAFNNKWVDAKPQPLNERLQAKAASVAPEKNAFFGLLALTGPGEPIEAGRAQWALQRVGDTPPSDGKSWIEAEPWRCSSDKVVCVEQWAGQHEAVAALLQKDSEWGERCAALAAPGMGFEEGRPDFTISFMKLNATRPSQSTAVRCTRWLLAQAAVAAERRQLDESMRRLEQSDRFVRMTLTGSNSLISHAIAWHNARLQWQTVAALAARHPAWARERAAQFDALLRPLPEEALVPHRWISFEAAYGRSAVNEIAGGCSNEQTRQVRFWNESNAELWLSCGVGLGFMAN